MLTLAVPLDMLFKFASIPLYHASIGTFHLTMFRYTMIFQTVFIESFVVAFFAAIVLYALVNVLHVFSYFITSALIRTMRTLFDESSWLVRVLSFEMLLHKIRLLSFKWATDATDILAMLAQFVTASRCF